MLSLLSMRYRREPEVERMPSLPMPGEDDEFSASQDSGPSMAKRPLSALTGNTFLVATKFWLIVHEMVWAYYSSRKNVSIPMAEYMFGKFLIWSDEIAPTVPPGSNATTIQ
jgi:hypothetical protein